MQISIAFLSGKTMTLGVESSYTIAKIKGMLEEKEGIPPRQQRLVIFPSDTVKYAGKQLEDDRTLADYEIRDKCNLCLILVLSGGGAFVDLENLSSLKKQEGTMVAHSHGWLEH